MDLNTRFDICEAYYVWACEWGEYETLAQLGRVLFRPSPSLNSRGRLTDEGKEIYDRLVRESKDRMAHGDFNGRHQP